MKRFCSTPRVSLLIPLYVNNVNKNKLNLPVLRHYLKVKWWKSKIVFYWHSFPCMGYNLWNKLCTSDKLTFASLNVFILVYFENIDPDPCSVILKVVEYVSKLLFEFISLVQARQVFNLDSLSLCHIRLYSMGEE